MTSARYLVAIDECDESVIYALWSQAATDPALHDAICEIHAGLAEEVDESEIEVRIVIGGES